MWHSDFGARGDGRLVRIPTPVRRVTDPVLIRLRMPVLSGVNRGCWWSLISAGTGYGSGRRASEQLRLIAELLRPGDCVWDVGAHHGFVTLCAAHRVGSRGQVHAFEPAALNRAVLLRHLRWNVITNVTVHPYALSDRDGEACFGGVGSSKTFRLGGGSETVAVRRGDTLIAIGGCPPPSFMKVDVEGAEADVIAGVLPGLTGHVVILIAMHSRQSDARCSELLHQAGFRLYPSRALQRCRASRWSGDPDLLATSPTSAGWDRQAALVQRLGF